MSTQSKRTGDGVRWGGLLRESGAVDTPCANAYDGGGGRDSPSQPLKMLLGSGVPRDVRPRSTWLPALLCAAHGVGVPAPESTRKRAKPEVHSPDTSGSAGLLKLSSPSLSV